MPPPAYDAVLLVSFGGPEGPDDVLPFLDNVLRDRDVPAARREAVADQYRTVGGVSPINGHNRALLAALREELATHGPGLPLYWGNRNWHPMLADTVATMRNDGILRALAFVTSAYSSASSCRQYLDDLVRARLAVGAGAPAIDKLRPFFDHPGFVEPSADRLRAALGDAGPDAPVLFSAHSIPVAMAATSDYEAQLREHAALVADRAGARSWQLVFQSRSGPPSQPWLEPDVRDAIADLAPNHDAVVVAPIGFVSDHMEVVFDLDTQAAAMAADLGVRLVRAGTVGTDPRFVTMIRQLIDERLDPTAPRLALGHRPPRPDRCPEGCCPAAAPTGGPAGVPR